VPSFGGRFRRRSFSDENGSWKLAGIHYTVDGPFYTDAQGGGGFDGALFDARGFYVFDGTQYVQITGTGPVPTGFYSTRISSKLAWIDSVTDPAGDPDADDLPNLLEYAFNLDPLVSDRSGAPQFTASPSSVALTYTKIVAATDLSYVVEKSTDLVTWIMASATDEILYDDGLTQIVRSTVNANGNPHLFLRLRVTRS
jgi:hypothetical protein